MFKRICQIKKCFLLSDNDKSDAGFPTHAVVLQCEADSLDGDRLGPFNLTLKYFYILSLQTNRIIIKFSHATRLHAIRRDPGDGPGGS